MLIMSRGTLDVYVVVNFSISSLKVDPKLIIPTRAVLTLLKWKVINQNTVNLLLYENWHIIAWYQ